MTPNPFSGLIHSRKFWLAILDCVSAILALWIGTLVAEQTAILIMGTWAAIQPVFITIIAAIAYEDKAAMEAASRIDVAVTASVTPPCDDEAKALLTEAYEQGKAGK
jgi:hypothetical protein